MKLPNEIKDNINPDHYKSMSKDKRIQCIDAIEASMTKNQFKGHLKACVIKYLWRYEDKHEDGIEDLRKAWWYLQRLIDANID